MRWMLLFVPVSLVLALLRVPALWLFAASCLAIVPLAGLLSTATEEFAKARGPAVGGLLNATFGNATELIICIVALQRNELDIVKASLIGSIIGNILLVLGLSILLGGVKYKIQKFNVDVAQAHATMLALAAVALLVPALFARSIPGLNEQASNPSIQNLSVGVAICGDRHLRRQPAVRAQDPRAVVSGGRRAGRRTRALVAGQSRPRPAAGDACHRV